MLGEQIGEELGQSTGLRVLPGDGVTPVFETSFQSSGRFMGSDSQNMGTYTASPRMDGTLSGTGQGVVMLADGAMVSWRGSGVGRMTGDGTGASWRGSLVFFTAAPQYSQLNSIAGIFEYEVDASGKTTGKTWEWK